MQSPIHSAKANFDSSFQARSCAGLNAMCQMQGLDAGALLVEMMPKHFCVQQEIEFSSTAGNSKKEKNKNNKKKMPPGSGRVKPRPCPMQILSDFNNLRHAALPHCQSRERNNNFYRVCFFWGFSAWESCQKTFSNNFRYMAENW